MRHEIGAISHSVDPRKVEMKALATFHNSYDSGLLKTADLAVHPCDKICLVPRTLPKISAGYLPSCGFKEILLSDYATEQN